MARPKKRSRQQTRNESHPNCLERNEWLSLCGRVERDNCPGVRLALHQSLCQVKGARNRSLQSVLPELRHLISPRSSLYVAWLNWWSMSSNQEECLVSKSASQQCPGSVSSRGAGTVGPRGNLQPVPAVECRYHETAHLRYAPPSHPQPGSGSIDEPRPPTSVPRQARADRQSRSLAQGPLEVPVPSLSLPRQLFRRG